MMRKLTRLIISLLFISSGLYAQKDSLNVSTGKIYQDLSKHFDLKDARFLLLMKDDRVFIDTALLSKINPDWLEKVNILKVDPGQKDSKISTVEIYIRKEYVNKAEKVIHKK